VKSFKYRSDLRFTFTKLFLVKFLYFQASYHVEGLKCLVYAFLFFKSIPSSWNALLLCIPFHSYHLTQFKFHSCKTFQISLIMISLYPCIKIYTTTLSAIHCYKAIYPETYWLKITESIFFTVSMG
jgi:hypothetical protein